MAYKYPDKIGNMVETPYLKDFIKGIDEARRRGYSPGLNTVYQAPKIEKVTFAESQKRLRKQTGTDFISSSEDRARAEFASMVGFAVAKELQAAGMTQREQAPLAARVRQSPPARQARQGISWADASRKLKADLGEDFLNEGAALQAKSKSQGPRAVRRFHEPMPGCKIKRF
jgi:hypothetical protein